MLLITNLTVLYTPMFDCCSHQIILLSHKEAYMARALLAAQLYRQHLVHQSLPRIQLHAAATPAATCITMLDDALLGGKDATYSCMSSSPSCSVLYHFSPFRLPPRRVSKHSHEFPTSLSYFILLLQYQCNSSHCWLSDNVWFLYNTMLIVFLCVDFPSITTGYRLLLC